MVQLSDLIPGCQKFQWKDALFLPKWQVCVFPADVNVEAYISQVGQTLERIEGQYGFVAAILSWYRPKTYNSLPSVRGALNSFHIQGGAIDFAVSGKSADQVREILKPDLEKLKIRMEDKPGSGWVHIDVKVVPPGGQRLVKP